VVLLNGAKISKPSGDLDHDDAAAASAGVASKMSLPREVRRATHRRVPVEQTAEGRYASPFGP
jgi:hypothetical protein